MLLMNIYFIFFRTEREVVSISPLKGGSDLPVFVKVGISQPFRTGDNIAHSGGTNHVTASEEERRLENLTSLRSK